MQPLSDRLVIYERQDFEDNDEDSSGSWFTKEYQTPNLLDETMSGQVQIATNVFDVKVASNDHVGAREPRAWSHTAAGKRPARPGGLHSCTGTN